MEAPKQFRTMEEIKIRAIKRALVHFEGNKIHAAKALGISVRSVRNYVKHYPELSEFKIVWPVHLREHSNNA
jgi:transcriptional regulator with PAS, ATPase and Fis domain